MGPRPIFHSLIAVESGDDLEQFLALGKNREWVEPIVRNQHPFSLFAETQSWVALRGGEAQARVTALIDRVSNERRGEDTGHLVLFEAVPDSHLAVQLMLWEGCGWLAARGCGTARMGFRSSCDMPFNIDAYGEPPTFIHRNNPPYYHSLLKHAGMQPGHGFIEYRLSFNDEWKGRYEATVDWATRRGIVIEPSKDHEVFARVMNECYTHHWGIPHYLPEEVALWTRGLGVSTPADFLLFATIGGELAGTTFGCLDFWNPGRGILFEICVREPFRGQGVNFALAARLFLALMREGCTEASYTLVLDDNWPSRRTAEKLGGVPARNFITYEKRLRDR